MTRWVAAVLALTFAGPAGVWACMRPAADERAVQWSTAVVEARLGSIGPETKLGDVQERRGALGALGVATVSYFCRTYTFEVTRSLDGPFKVGEKVPVVRLFSRTQEPPIGGGGGCAQHLSPEGVGKEFLLMVRALSEFKAVVPNGVKPPDVKGAMWVVHLEAKDSVKPEAMRQLMTTIEGVRAAEQQYDPARADRMILQIQSTVTDAQAGPSVRALERMGLKVLPAVQAAAMKVNGAARTRLLGVVNDLTPPEPVNGVEVMKGEGGR